MKRTKRKINKKKLAIFIALAIVFIFCAYIVLHDLYMLTIYSWITGKMAGWTWYGFITFILACMTISVIWDYFNDDEE